MTADVRDDLTAPAALRFPGGVVAQPLAVQTLGQGPRQALALHCTLGRGGAWRGLVAALGEDRVTVTAPDMLSHGDSPDWDRTGDYHDRATQSVAPLLRPGMDLIGHSFGATVALRLAALYPGQVRSLVLVEPVLFAAARLDQPALVDEMVDAERPIVAALLAGDEALAARLFNRRWSEGGPRWAEMPERMRAGLTRSIHVLAASHPAILLDRPGLTRPETLARVDLPVLLISGAASQPVVPVACAAMAARLADARHVVVPGAGHMVPVTHANETAAHIGAFWDSLGPRG